MALLYIGKYYYLHILWYFSCHMYNCWKLLIMSTYLSWMWTHLGILVYWTRFGNLPNRQVRGTWEPTSYNEVKLKLINSHLKRFFDLVRLSISNSPWTTRWEKQQSQPGAKEVCQISPGTIFWNSWDKIFQVCTISAKYTDLFLKYKSAN